MIAVVGATGNTGRAVIKELKALGQNPVAVVRNADKAREALGATPKSPSPNRPTKRRWSRRSKASSWFSSHRHNPAWSSSRTTSSTRPSKRAPKYLVRVSGGAAIAFPGSPSVVGQGHLAIEKRLYV